MKKLLLMLTLFAPCLAFAGTPPEVIRVDATGQQYTNSCTGEKVTVTDGDFVLVYRRDYRPDANGIHILNKAAGSFTAIGNDTGHEYRVNVTGRQPDIPSVLNSHDYIGVLNITIHLEVIDLSNPGSGISQLRVAIVIALDGSPTGSSRVDEVFWGCVGG